MGDPSLRRWARFVVAHRRAVIVLLALLLTGCTVLPDRPSGKRTQALCDTADTTLGKLAASRMVARFEAKV